MQQPFGIGLFDLYLIVLDLKRCCVEADGVAVKINGNIVSLNKVALSGIGEGSEELNACVNASAFLLNHTDDVCVLLLALLDSLKSHAVACEGDEGIVCAHFALGLDVHGNERMVDLKTSFKCLCFLPGFRMRIERVGEVVLASVGCRIGLDRSLEQGEDHLVLIDLMTVLAVVEEGNAVILIGHINPVVSVDLKLGLVVRIVSV